MMNRSAVHLSFLHPPRGYHLERDIMRRFPAFGSVLLCLLLTVLWTGCSSNPNVKKQKYLASGQHYFDQQRYREAVIQFSNAVQVDPNFAQAHYQLGETLLRLQDLNHAFGELSRALELQQGSPETHEAPLADSDIYQAHADLANLLISTRQPDGLKQAKAHLDLLREKQPNSVETYAAWSNYYLAQNNLPAATQEMQKAIDADRTRSDSYLNMALLETRSNLPDQAETNFKKAAEVAPKSMNAQLALGGFYQSRNRFPEAEQQFRKAISTDLKDPAPRAALVRLMMVEGRRAEAETLLKDTKAALPDNSDGYRMLGDFYFASGDLDKATAEYGSLFNDHPRDPQVKKNYIQLLILKNRLDEATKLNDPILKASPHDVDALVYRGQIQLRQNNAGAAVDSLQEALRNDPNNAVAHYQLGIAFDQQHADDRAEAEWHEAVRLKPDLTDAQQALAQVQLRRGDTEGLLQSAQQLISAQPPVADGFLLRAVVEISRQKFTDAEADLRKAMELAPSSPAPYVQMGAMRLAQKQFGEAQKFYRQALEKDPASAEGLRGLMAAYIQDKQVDKALAAANEQIAKSPQNSSFYDLLGTVLFEAKKDTKGAETALRKAVELDKNNSNALVKLGKVQIAEGAADQALATYQQSIKDNPREVTFYILAGEIYESKAQWDQAKSMYQQALNIQSDNPTASNNLAYLILQQGGNVDLALAMAQTARRGIPDSPNFADTLGWAYYQKGVYKSAISLFQESMRLNEKQGGADDADVHYHLGMAYQKSNQPALARQQLERALKIKPTYSDARKALSDLHG
jgi:tetratricopeptide (TPR) repeat protein